MTTSSTNSATPTKGNTWTVPQIMSEYSLSRGAIRRLIHTGRFPQPVEWNPTMGAKKICRYDREEVRKHLDKYHLPGTGDEGYRVKLNNSELKFVKSAARLVYLDPDQYMVKVLMNHARKIHSFANEQHED